LHKYFLFVLIAWSRPVEKPFFNILAENPRFKGVNTPAGKLRISGAKLQRNLKFQNHLPTPRFEGTRTSVRFRVTRPNAFEEFRPISGRTIMSALIFIDTGTFEEHGDEK